MPPAISEERLHNFFLYAGYLTSYLPYLTQGHSGASKSFDYDVASLGRLPDDAAGLYFLFKNLDERLIA